MAKAKGTQRYSSRPARIPTVKAKVTDEMKDAVDTIGEALDDVVTVYDPFPRYRPAGKVRWEYARGRSDTIWVVNVQYKGSWNYKSLNKALHKAEKALPKTQLVVLVFLINELDKQGNVTHERWVTVPGGIQVWASAVKAAMTQTSPNVKGSFGARYRHTVIKEFHIQIASEAQKVEFL